MGGGFRSLLRYFRRGRDRLEVCRFDLGKLNGVHFEGCGGLRRRDPARAKGRGQQESATRVEMRDGERTRFMATASDGQSFMSRMAMSGKMLR